MYNNIIFHEIKRILRNILLISGVALIISFAYLLRITLSFSTILRGPETIDIDNITKTKHRNPSNNDYVTVTGEKIYNLQRSYTESDINDGELETNLKGKYFALRKGNKIIVGLVPKDEKADIVLSGFLYKLDDNETERFKNIVEECSAVADDDEYGNKPVIIPYMIDGLIYDDYNNILIISASIVFVISLIFFIRCIVQWFKPERNKIYNKLRIYGKPDEVINSIETDAKIYEPVTYGKTIIFNNWIINKTAFGIKVVKIDKLIWVYKNIIKQRLNYIIPCGKEYSLMLCLGNREIINFKTSNKNVDKIMYKLKDCHPWIVFGYSEQLKSMWEYHFDEFRKTVNSRREETK